MASLLGGLARVATSLLVGSVEVVQLQCLRFRSMRASRRIRGYPRPLVKGVVRPEPMKYGFIPILPEDGVYTTEKLPIRKLAGRHPETGRVVVRTIGGGMKRWFRWVDYKRQAPASGAPLEERVYQVRYDPCRTARIALVASGDSKRWLVATEGTKPGDIIRTSGDIPRIPVRPRDGDAHPLGALPVSTLVHHVEKYPGDGGTLCRAAGASAQLLRKVDGRVILQLPSKRQVSLSELCMAVVGQVSNANRMETFYPIGSPNRLRRLGKRPQSGFWHRKDGYCGRKVRPLPPVKVYPLQRPTLLQ
ncbi:39S ribosomal protein L2, mitochondrial [Ixodes scapularis]|uniref:39S ribosomal protein L2, mitochondrial n=1 Tax=Ixodes scapularis TaxID=6945 RepID=UPI001A9E0860|nr:39S ribosomal protein L2, mitochondrial [Ixodes scapularis]